MTAALAERPTNPAADPLVDRAVAGDDTAFTMLVERHRRELHAHCRRMLSSPERAEDALQDALLRAWRSRSGFAGRATFRTWLYRIATNACLDEMRRDRWPGRPDPTDVAVHHEPVSPDPGPDALLEAADATERACRTIVALLPPKQRAALILCDVLRCSSGETARLLDTTVAAVNSARQRARATLDDARPSSGAERPGTPLGTAHRALLLRYTGALQRHDVAAVIALATDDATGVLPAG